MSDDIFVLRKIEVWNSLVQPAHEAVDYHILSAGITVACGAVALTTTAKEHGTRPSASAAEAIHTAHQFFHEFALQRAGLCFRALLISDPCTLPSHARQNRRHCFTKGLKLNSRALDTILKQMVQPLKISWGHTLNHIRGKHSI